MDYDGWMSNPHDIAWCGSGVETEAGVSPELVSMVLMGQPEPCESMREKRAKRRGAVTCRRQKEGSRVGGTHIVTSCRGRRHGLCPFLRASGRT